MRQLISGLVAAIAVMTASAVPAMACGGGLFQGSCSPCGAAYAAPCAQPQVYYGYSGCNTGCGGWGYERLPDPVHQYYHVNQGPTYSGPGNFAPYPAYEESALPVYPARPHYRPWRARTGYYGVRPSVRYGYAPVRRYAPRFYPSRHSLRYGAPMGMPRAYGYRERLPRRYY